MLHKLTYSTRGVDLFLADVESFLLFDLVQYLEKMSTHSFQAHHDPNLLNELGTSHVSPLINSEEGENNSEESEGFDDDDDDDDDAAEVSPDGEGQSIDLSVN